MADAKKKYTEADLRDAFRCGLQHGAELHGATTEAAQRVAESVDWIDCLFYQGFRNESLFTNHNFIIFEGCQIAVGSVKRFRARLKRHGRRAAAVLG